MPDPNPVQTWLDASTPVDMSTIPHRILDAAKLEAYERSILNGGTWTVGRAWGTEENPQSFEVTDEPHPNPVTAYRDGREVTR